MYGKCPKISYTKVSNKLAYAYSADQTAPEGMIRIYTVCRFSKYIYFNKKNA